ncbi:uncharacterized protein F5147DRAFT_712312 [Suillus discolor]|uniref:Uncharacterized protein n=1 Tax=Suillus discolor TaxID=1912936 RepID=A0A9P7EZ33_9AGAM|nr:uncharacterized protein F5147DRAFT_712312 [Suillus discolor]KAG2099229.1 hypothetical protein F5147DRAFT_712312 [Suillus discolor]
MARILMFCQVAFQRLLAGQLLPLRNTAASGRHLDPLSARVIASPVLSFIIFAGGIMVHRRNTMLSSEGRWRSWAR